MATDKSAERLAASKEKSPLEKSVDIRGCWVLNASRHHRKNRPTERIELFTFQMCSTPRGITGKIALLRRQGRPVFKVVLNASRHHRKNRPVYIAEIFV